MTLQPDDFWSFSEWLMRPDAPLESAALQGVVLFVLTILLGFMVAYVISSARYGPSEGFFAVASAVRDFFRSDLPGSSFRRIGALARLAFKEAIRRKVLFIIGLFLVLLLIAGWYLNPESDDPARLYISFVLTTTNYLVLVLAIFISAFSLPTDIQSKTIYTIVTKPVRATEIVLGRILGFITVGTVVLVPMGLSSYIFVKRGLRHTHYEVVEVQEKNGRYTGVTDYVQNHQHTFAIESGETTGLTNIVRGHRHLVTRTEAGDFEIGPPIGALKARVPSYGDILFLDRQGNPQDVGIDVGNERLAGGYGSAGVARVIGQTSGSRQILHSYIEGGTLGAAIFTFKDVTPERYPDGIPIDVSIRAYRSFKGDIDVGLRASLTVKHPDNQTEMNPIPFIVNEYELDEKRLPLRREGTVKGETRTLDMFDDLVNEDNELQVVLRCLDRSQYLGVTKSGIYLRPADHSFESNLFKAYASIWLQMSMVIAFGVMFSTFLSGPVAMVSTAVTLLLGFFAEMIFDTRHYMDEGIARGGGPIESLVRLLRQDAMTTQLDVDEFAGRVIRIADTMIVYTMDAIATALPNLPKMVQTAEYAASGLDIFAALLARHAVAALGYCIIAFVISHFILKSREIAA